MIKFVIVSTQRSGSAFLVTCLSSHPKIQCYREIFLPSNPKPETYRTYRTASLGRQLDHLFRRKRLVDDYLANLYASSDGVDALGFKFMYSQAWKFPEVVAWIKEHKAKVIHLIRKNTLKRIISGRIAQKRNVFHSTEPLEPIKVHLKPGKLKARLALSMRQIETYRQVFADNPYLEVTYESFATRRNDEARRILQFLGIEPVVPLTTDLVKLNPDSLVELIENYEEVTQSLKGTAFERYLD